MNGLKVTRQDILALSEMFDAGMNDEEIAEALGRTRPAVMNKRHDLGLMTNKLYKRWTDEEIDVVRTWKGDVSDLAKTLGRTYYSVLRMRERLGIKRNRELTKLQVDTIIAAWDKNWSVNRIAKSAHVEPKLVRKAIREVRPNMERHLGKNKRSIQE